MHTDIGVAFALQVLLLQLPGVDEITNKSPGQKVIQRLIVAAGVFYYYWKNRKRGLNVSIYLLIGLKLYLVVFYSFFYVPFSYLFMLPMFLTIPLLYQIRFFSNS